MLMINYHIIGHFKHECHLTGILIIGSDMENENNTEKVKNKTDTRKNEEKVLSEHFGVHSGVVNYWLWLIEHSQLSSN